MTSTGRRITVFLVLSALIAIGCDDAASTSADGDPPAIRTPSSVATSVAGFLERDERFEILVELLSSKDVPGHDASFIEVMDAEGDPSTLFAPTDAAFEALGSGAVQELVDGPWLTSVLERHIAHGNHLSAGLRNGQLQTWGPGTTVPVEVDGDNVTYGAARVIEPDIELGRWVVHVIDAVVLPPHVESALS